ncbi:MAG: hypothetical protein HOL66_06995 [Rhodospirillaceae bacterium]|nr:hypothetical protein [Rhodospirillaceae bacterium]MBT5243973.1 hypothetical protein [Rhodospirillaceae bacterium]MBT5560954.1 hypothetical protein [Rhodospirillaceae bacterium]MBT6242485.1 hypothetical protein [Rhodospirillaceae bacterium]MBT7137822.1 hypothetical protein [Rhodospirillaceae bacterium]
MSSKNITRKFYSFVPLKIGSITLQSAIANLKSQNVTFQVCANTLKGKKISQDSLYEVFDEDIVPSGVAELAHLQAQGYTYIKP